MVSSPVSFEQLAVLKVLLHAAKHPQRMVNGLLLGSVSESTVSVVDAVPLFHNSSALAVPTEVALGQVEAYTQQSEGGPCIVGYYQADARMQAADIGPISRRVADKLVDRYSRAVLLLLDNKKLQAFVKGGAAHPFELFDHENKAWRREPAERVAISGGVAKLREGFSAALASSSHRMLVDFDDHLDDVGNDWCNSGLKNMGKMQLPGQLR